MPSRQASLPLRDVAIGAKRGKAFGHHVHSWMLGGDLDRLVDAPHRSEGSARTSCGARVEGRASVAEARTANVRTTPVTPADTSATSCTLPASIHSDFESDANIDSDSEVRDAERRLRQAKRELMDAQHGADNAMRERQRKLRRTMDAFEEENQKIREGLAEAQVAHERTLKLLSSERATVDIITKRIDDAREEKHVLESQVAKLEEDVRINVRRASLLGGEVSSIKACSDDELELLIRDGTEAVARMQRERAERLQTATRCVVCLDRARALLLRPCNHLCLCETCGSVVDQCPLCRQAIDEKIRVHA